MKRERARAEDGRWHELRGEENGKIGQKKLDVRDTNELHLK